VTPSDQAAAPSGSISIPADGDHRSVGSRPGTFDLVTALYCADVNWFWRAQAWSLTVLAPRILGPILGLTAIAYALVMPFMAFVHGFQAVHGIAGTITIQHCVGGSGRGVHTWVCYGPFRGADGTSISQVALHLDGDDTPTGIYDAMAASPTAGRVYQPGVGEYLSDLALAIGFIGIGGLILRLSARRRRREAS
jgi:hypothetical protein